MELEWILGIHVLSLSGITWCYHSGSIHSHTLHKYLIIIASFLTQLLASQYLEIACIMTCHAVRSKTLPKLKLKNKYKLTLYLLTLTTTLTIYSKLLLEEEFLMLWVACAIVRYLEQKSRPFTITYGEGVACGFTVGFLSQVIPPSGKWVSSYSQSLASRHKRAHQNVERINDAMCVMLDVAISSKSNISIGNVYGERFSSMLHDVVFLVTSTASLQISIFDVLNYHGIVEAIQDAGQGRGVRFPLRRLLVVYPRSLYCPRNLDAFNKSDETLPSLERCESLPDIHFDVAGVTNRVYRLPVYKIRRHPADPRPVHVVCATPINTLWMMLRKRTVYTPFAWADTEEISEAFCATLRMIIRNSDELRDKCDLVYYDDTDPKANLAEVLLAKIREIEPNYEDFDIDL